MTRSFPPIEGQDPTDHADMHPGLSLGFAILNGVNFWHNREGRVQHDGFLGDLESGKSGAFAVRNRYEAPDGKLICRETAHYRILPNTDGYLITIVSRYESDQPFYFGVKEEMGWAVRMATPLRVRGGQGTILSSEGGRDEKETWGQSARWWDYFGSWDDHSIGIQIMSGPGNPPVWSHSRDYGLLVANPFPVDLAPHRNERIAVQLGKVLTLTFGVQIHEHVHRKDFDPVRAYGRYQETTAR